jgi:hypothetical protein
MTFLITTLLYLLLGAVAGLIAGLFGVGGGVVIVPALVFSFALQGFSVEILTHAAVGTSLATIIVTSISSVRAHHLKGAVLWRLFWALAPGISVGVWLGVNTAVQISGPQLQLAIGCFLLVIAVQMGLGLRPSPSSELPGKPALFLAGGVIGWISALFGIGGGSLTVPYLSWCNVRMQQAVATSAACGLPIALVGAASNVAVGWQHAQMPQWSSGFVYWPAFAGIVLASAPFAKVGAQLAHRLPADLLKRYFALFIFIVGFALMAGS